MVKMRVLINKNSGTVRRLGEEAVKGLLAQHLGHIAGGPEFLEGAEIGPLLKGIVGESEGVLVGGGDGTAALAAEILGEAKTPFGILPLGTMNLLAQDLGAAPSFEATLENFSRLYSDNIDAGTVNGRSFLCSAVVGFVPESAVVREELREEASLGALARFIGTIQRGMSGDIRSKLLLRLKEEHTPYALETTSLVVSNNSFAKHPGPDESRFRRETLTDGMLAVYSAAPKDMLDGLRIALSLWQGDWQDHESILSFTTKELIVDAEERKVLVSLDGEPVEMEAPLRFSIRARSLPVLRWELKT
jgi:diacylglycerol kinase family enzyme